MRQRLGSGDFPLNHHSLPGFDRRFLFNGFLSGLSHQESLLYLFLVLAADRDGLSFFSYDKICQFAQA